MKFNPLQYFFIRMPRCGGSAVENYFLEYHYGDAGTNPVYSQYVDNHDDLLSSWNNRSNNNYSITFNHKSDFGRHHYDNFGKNEGRELPLYFPSFLSHHTHDSNTTEIPLSYLKWSDIVPHLEMQNSQEWFSSTIVRNPFSKVVSTWKMFCNNCKIKGSLEDFLLQKNEFNFLTKPYYNIFTISQKEYLSNDKGEIMIDYIAKFENFQNDFYCLCKMLDIEHLPVSQQNQSYLLHYSNYYDDDTRSLVENLYKDDLQSFGYKFDHQK